MFLDGGTFFEKVVIFYVDKRGVDVSNFYRDGRFCFKEDDFWILVFCV